MLKRTETDGTSKKSYLRFLWLYVNKLNNVMIARAEFLAAAAKDIRKSMHTDRETPTLKEREGTERVWENINTINTN